MMSQVWGKFWASGTEGTTVWGRTLIRSSDQLSWVSRFCERQASPVLLGGPEEQRVSHPDIHFSDCAVSGGR